MSAVFDDVRAESRFTSNSGKIAALQRIDAQGHVRTSSLQETLNAAIANLIADRLESLGLSRHSSSSHTSASIRTGFLWDAARADPREPANRALDTERVKPRPPHPVGKVSVPVLRDQCILKLGERRGSTAGGLSKAEADFGSIRMASS